MSEMPTRQPTPLILIVDDDRTMRRMLQRAMAQQGYQVVEAENGGEALIVYQRVQPDLVLLDAMMPVMDGFEACRALRQLPANEHTPILLITGLDDTDSVDRAFAAGATDYVTKPIHWAVLRQRVQRVLRTRQAEAALQRTYEQTERERERLRLIIDASRDGIVLLSPQRTILDLNHAVLQMLNLPGTPADWRDQRLEAALIALRMEIPEVIDPTLAQVHSIHPADNEEVHGEYDFRIGTEVRTVVYTDLPVQAAEGIGRLVVLRDTTEERAIQRLREDLTRMLVHDIRNPLSASFTAVQMLEMLLREPHPQIQSLVRIIKNNNKQALGLVTTILDVSRLEAGQMPVDAKPTELEPVIQAVVRDVSPLAQEKGLVLEPSVVAGLPLAYADCKLVERVIRNLVGNALKFTPKGGTVRVTAGCADNDLLLAVEDTGAGLSKELQARLFTKWATGATEGHGSGLGLAFCKLAVEAMGGRIWAESEAGQGSSFRFTLPAAPTQTSP
ncbi:MAG: response regulator [Herpetosiphonaceae bacterium]|nr:response regulator [Herpetosiphonaceae bacterium]